MAQNLEHFLKPIQNSDQYDFWCHLQNYFYFCFTKKYWDIYDYSALKEQTQKRLVDSLPNYLKLGKNGLVEKNAKESEQKSEPSKFDKFKKKKQD